MLEFQWAVTANKIILVNPVGTVSICCMWTPASFLEKTWQKEAPELFAPTSPICLIGGLYGGGLKIMLRNLHHNPQIDTLILLGKDFSGVVEHVVNFFQGKVIKTGQKQLYKFADGRQEELEKILIEGQETSHSLDELIQPDLFASRPTVLNWTRDPQSVDPAKLRAFLKTYRPKEPAPNVRPPAIPLPRPVIATFPSELAGQTVVAETIPEAWVEVLFRLSRFGPLIRLRNGKERNELLNLKVVITNPGGTAPEDLSAYNLSESRIEAYKADLLKSELEDGGSYTYGHRLRAYFGQDQLARAAQDLAVDLDSRHAYITLWDNQRDPEGSDAPCLVSLFFRKIDRIVHLTATFRSHNGARAWPVNCFGLWGLLSTVVSLANSQEGKTETRDLTPGQLTVISQSISLDPSEITEVAGLLAKRKNRPYQMVLDPHGYFKVTLNPEDKLILVWHFNHEDELVAQYEGATPGDLIRELTNHLALSDLGHALYLGGQLERAYYCLARGLEYIQDKTKLTD
ncbi:MAG: hypothetical protein LBS60_11785 [Deltaproteobacteria bacterium]|jgi:thymidylate synthase|nr:hypothetical protein [Deltaproteobacteria bacterium]